jgi:hypothetical protein
VVANFDVLFFAKKGFATLARAKIIKFRPKGRKDIPWEIIDVSKLRKKLDKQKALFRALEHFRREHEKSTKKERKKEEKIERKRIKSLHAVKEAQSKDKIKFRLVKTDERIIRSKEGRDVRYKNYVYELTKLLKFVSGTKSPNSIQIEQFMLAVGEQFKKVYKVHKKTHYFLRITHRYKALKSRKENDPKDKKFDGFAIPRFKVDAISDIDSAILVLIESYLPRFEKYLKFATANTSFDFLGFTLETTLPNIR